MLKDMNSETLFCEYYRQWVDIYKKRGDKGSNNGKVPDDAEVG